MKPHFSAFDYFLPSLYYNCNITRCLMVFHRIHAINQIVREYTRRLGLGLSSYEDHH